MLSVDTDIGVSCLPRKFLSNIQSSLLGAFLQATYFHNFADKKKENYSKHVTSFYFMSVCNEMVHWISIKDLLLRKSKQKHHLYANKLSLMKIEFNGFHFPKNIVVERSRKNSDLSQKLGN